MGEVLERKIYYCVLMRLCAHEAMEEGVRGGSCAVIILVVMHNYMISNLKGGLVYVFCTCTEPIVCKKESSSESECADSLAEDIIIPYCYYYLRVHILAILLLL